MSFERNFFKPSAVCPKCGLDDPKPKYIPQRLTWEYECDSHLRIIFGNKNLYVPPTEKDIIPDKVVCLCVCGHEWEQK